MSKLQEGQVWNNRYHGRPSTIVEVFVKDEKIWVRYRVEQPYYRDEPEERALDEELFKGLYTLCTEHV